jgi:glycosyltransferase involved in cell wall biosynthesis
VPYGNPAALEAALQTLRTDPALGIRLGSNGRRAYMEKYSWQMMEEKITGIYKGLLNL